MCPGRTLKARHALRPKPCRPHNGSGHITWIPFPGARSLLHLSVKSTSPRWCPAAPASIRVSSEFHSGDVNNHSGPGPICVPHPAGIPIHIAPESVFTISRNAYSPGPESAHGKSRTEGRTGCRLRDARDLPAIRYQPGQLIPYKKLRRIVNVIDCQHLPAIEIGGTVISLA